MRRRGVALAAALAAVSAVAFLGVAASIGPAGAVPGYDTAIADALRSARGPLLDRLFWAFTLLGDTPVAWALGASAAALLVLWGRRAAALLVVAAVGVGSALGSLAKLAVERARPLAAAASIARPESHSFPSGHALFAALFAGAVLFVLLREVRSPRARAALVALGSAFAVMVGASRVHLGVHWPSDVLGAWCLGGAWLAVTCGAYAEWARRGGRTAWPPVGSERTRRLALLGAAVLTGATLALTAWRDPLLAEARGQVAPVALLPPDESASGSSAPSA